MGYEQKGTKVGRTMRKNIKILAHLSTLVTHSFCITHCGIRKLLIRQNTDNSMTLAYRILLRNEPEGGYSVVVPSLPGCVTFGDSVEEAITMAKEAIELYIESLRAHKEKIPTDEI
jgi:antitoxin HicB